jgi:hypothetical protein
MTGVLANARCARAALRAYDGGMAEKDVAISAWLADTVLSAPFPDGRTVIVFVSDGRACGIHILPPGGMPAFDALDKAGASPAGPPL